MSALPSTQKDGKWEEHTLLELLAFSANEAWDEVNAEYPKHETPKEEFFVDFLENCWESFWKSANESNYAKKQRQALVRLVSWQEDREEAKAKEAGELFPDFHDEFFEELRDDVDHLAI